MKNNHCPAPKRSLVCPSCHGRDFKVAYTKRRDGYIDRSRECVTCEKRMLTREKPAWA
jgi:transcriptional regulator NrdR family protein